MASYKGHPGYGKPVPAPRQASSPMSPQYVETHRPLPSQIMAAAAAGMSVSGKSGSMSDAKAKTVLKEAVDAVVNSFAKHSSGYGRGNYPICSKYQISKCYLKEIGKLIYQDAQNVIHCDCPYPCQQTTYDVSVSTSQFPSDILVQVLSSHFNTSQERLKDNILEISIFYDKLNYFWMNQVPKYERIGDVLASIGGQMGLFIGASVLTMLEFMEIIFLVLLFIFKQLCFKPRKTPKDAVA